METEMTLSLAYRMIAPFVYVGQTQPCEVTERVKEAANFIIKNEAPLPVFQSEKFCIAVCCELDFSVQREAAWFLVSDMLKERFSWVSYLNCFSFAKALAKAGFVVNDYCCSEELVSSLTRRVRLLSAKLPMAIIEKYDLPTVVLRPGKILDEGQQKERLRFNFLYAGNHETPSVL